MYHFSRSIYRELASDIIEDCPAHDLQELQKDPHPLARLVAASALAREETRGAHARAEFPEPDPALDARHTVLSADSETPAFAAWL